MLDFLQPWCNAAKPQHLMGKCLFFVVEFEKAKEKSFMM